MKIVMLLQIRFQLIVLLWLEVFELHEKNYAVAVQTRRTEQNENKLYVVLILRPW